MTISQFCTSLAVGDTVDEYLLRERGLPTTRLAAFATVFLDEGTKESIRSA